MMPLMLLILYVFQFLQIGFFSLSHKEFSLGGLIFVGVQTFVILQLNKFEERKKQQDVFEIAMLE